MYFISTRDATSEDQKVIFFIIKIPKYLLYKYDVSSHFTH